MGHWVGPDMTEWVAPNLHDGEKEVILITHDEMIVYANDANSHFWQENSSTKSIRPKSNGSSIMVSGFACSCHGFCILDDGRKTYTTIKPGKNRDGYWTNKNLVDQKEKADPIFKELHPNCVRLYGYDNSANHHAKSPDALCAENLNLSDGGKHVKPLRPTTWNGAEQLMQHPDGTQKGIRTILQERGCWRDGMVLEDARRILNSHPDFAVSKSWLQETVDKLGAELIFYPKFHCELNFIEMIWAYAKRDLRFQCTFSYPELEARLPVALRNVPLAYFKRVQRHCFRFMDGYRKGLIGAELDYVVKKFRGHRDIPSVHLELVKAQFAEKR